MEALAILIFILILVLAPFLFVGWVVYAVVRVVVGGVGSVVRSGSKAIAGSTTAAHTVRCPVDGCHAVSPVDARFCRRCGHGLPAAQRVQVRRAAVW